MLAERKVLLSWYYVFFNCSRNKFEVLIVNVFFRKVLALQILRYSRTLLAFNYVFHSFLFDFSRDLKMFSM